jgi:putative sporulation protein YtaF
MKTFIHLLFLSIAANLDNLGVGVAYGVKRIKIPFISNLMIAGIAFFFGTISVLTGTWIGHYLADSIANTIGALLIMGVGLWMVLPRKLQLRLEKNSNQKEISIIIKILHEPEEADTDRSALISWQESVLLGVALSINVFTNGISAGLWKLNIIGTAFGMAIFSFITIKLGIWLGSRYGLRWLGNKANLAAGIILILIGIHQII